jgi:4-amino-4-deoxy-L-arabinose transferase-like glycosyltransferase
MNAKLAARKLTLTYGLMLALLALAFVLRLEHLLARIFHIDEYISMLAAQMTADKGAPIFPSGLFYGHGLLTSYLAAPFLRLFGFSEEMARWPSLLVGMLGVASFYLVGLRLFKSRAAGLFAMTFAALDIQVILWSARMRMYALAGLLMLLVLYFLARGTFLEPKPGYRLAAAACYLGAILSHSVAVVALPVLVAASVIVIALGHKKFRWDWYRRDGVRLEVVIVLVLVLLGVGYSLAEQLPFLSPGAGSGAGGGGVQAVLGKFLEPGVSWERVDDFLYYFTSPAYWPLMLLGVWAMVRALVALVRGELTRRDLATLFLGLVFWLTIAELGLAVTHTWRKTRYLFILCQAPFLLLAADGLARLGESGAALLRTRARSLAPAATVLGIAAILAFWGDPAIGLAAARGTGGYDTAFKWVDEHWQAGDRVMTVHPSAAYLYLGRSDYYATQTTARTLLDDELEEVDRYVGSDLLDSVAALNQALSQKGRLWFVVDTNRLFSRYELPFVEQVFAQMDVVKRGADVLVFLSRPYPRPLPAQPLVSTQASFGDLIELGGYSLDLDAMAPDRSLQLALYWRPKTAQLSKVYKVFVQLRDEQDDIVAQADHYIFEGFVTASLLEQAGQSGDWLRDSADLVLPTPLPAGRYRLLVGLYDPDSLDRVPVVADRSGENAVLLETVSIP